MSLKTAILQLFKPANVAPEPSVKQLGEDLAAPSSQGIMPLQSTGAVRRALDPAWTGDLDLGRARAAMRAAMDLSNPQLFIREAMAHLQRTPQLQALLETRVLAVANLNLIAEQGGSKLVDRKAAEAGQLLLKSTAVTQIVPHLLLQGVYLNCATAQIFIDASSQPWKVSDIRDVPSHYLVFDRVDGRTPYLLPAEQGGPLTELTPGKFIYHSPSIIRGNPLTASLAYAELFYGALLSVTLRGWSGFVELYGMPIRVGKYPNGMQASAQGKKDLKVFGNALKSIGADAWAMVPEDMKIEIIEAASRNGSAEVYERLVRWVSENRAQHILGGNLTSGTGNTGSGGSQALGSVHNELREDRLAYDAKMLSATLTRWLVEPLTKWNIAGAATPLVYVQIEKVEELSTRVDALTKFMDRGLKVPTEEAYTLLDIRPPEGDEETIGGTAPQTGQPQAAPDQKPTVQQKAQFAAEGDGATNDELDTLVEDLQGDGYKLIDDKLDELLFSAIDAAGEGNVMQVLEAFKTAIKTGDVNAFAGSFVEALAAARVAGENGASLGV